MVTSAHPIAVESTAEFL